MYIYIYKYICIYIYIYIYIYLLNRDDVCELGDDVVFRQMNACCFNLVSFCLPGVGFTAYIRWN